VTPGLQLLSYTAIAKQAVYSRAHCTPKEYRKNIQAAKRGQTVAFCGLPAKTFERQELKFQPNELENLTARS